MKSKSLKCQRVVFGIRCKQSALPDSLYCSKHQQRFKNQTFSVGSTKFSGQKTNEVYQKYIDSEQWKTRAKRERAFWNNHCVLCHRSQKTLHVHHSTYVRLGNEQHGDLIVLCDSCHEMFHKFYVYDSSVGYFVPKK